MKNIRIGIIGTGQMGTYHIEQLKTIPGVEIIAVCGRDPLKLKTLSHQYAIPKTYTDYPAMIADADLDAIDICLHNNLHMPAATQALNAGKHVFCEKPIAGTYLEGKTMIDAARRNRKDLSIQISSLFSPETKAARYMMDQDYLGTVFFAQSIHQRRRGRPYIDGYGRQDFVRKETSGGGALIDLAIYHVAPILYLLGNPHVVSVTGKTYQESELSAEAKAASGYDVEDLGTGFVRLEKNISLYLLEAWSANMEGIDTSAILGSTGGLSLSPFKYYSRKGPLDFSAEVDIQSFVKLSERDLECPYAYASPLHHWIAGLQGLVELLPTAELALASMLITEGIYLSEEKGKEVSSEEIQTLSKSTALAL